MAPLSLRELGIVQNSIINLALNWVPRNYSETREEVEGHKKVKLDKRLGSDKDEEGRQEKKEEQEIV